MAQTQDFPNASKDFHVLLDVASTVLMIPTVDRYAWSMFIEGSKGEQKMPCGRGCHNHAAKNTCCQTKELKVPRC